MKTDAKNPYVIPVFIPFEGCPNKCFFCNQNAVTGLKKAVLPQREELLLYFNEFLSYTRKKNMPLEVAFFGGNFLGMDNSLIIKYLDIAKEFTAEDETRGIRFSTRPDTILNDKLNLIENYPVKTIELGIQSLDDRVLRKSGRGHTALDSFNAVNLIKKRFPDVNLGLQIMPGLPGETPASIVKTLNFIKYSKPAYLRIYPLIVLKNTQLEKLYYKGLYEPLSLDKAVDTACIIRDFCVRRNISIIRMGLPPEGAKNHEMVAGPWHPGFGDLVIQKSIYKKIVIKILTAFTDTKDQDLVIHINPSLESSVRGFKNKNYFSLIEKFGLNDIVFEKNPLCEKNRITLSINDVSAVIFSA